MAIVAVLLTHDAPIVVHGHSFQAMQSLGGWGVQLFFAISGLLVCGRILDAERSTGRFKVGAFYVRRLFRIQPALLVYLAVVGPLMLVHLYPGCLKAWIGALFLYTNFQFNEHHPLPGMSVVGQFWTLGVEEHFYILLSILLVAFRKNRVLVFSLLLACLLTAQSFASTAGLFDPLVSPRRTYWQLQYLLFPSLCAILVRYEAIGTFVKAHLRPWVAFCLTTDWLLITVGPHKPGQKLVNALNSHIDLLIYLMPVCLLATMHHPRSWTTRVLEWEPLRWIGRLSYSLYLWHLLFFSPGFKPSQVSWPPLLYFAHHRWARYGASLALACLSYYLVEKPMMRLGHRLAPPLTPGHRDLAVEPLRPRKEQFSEAAISSLS